MRLLKRGPLDTFSLTENISDEGILPQYAILSHTWGPESEEVTFEDFLHGTTHEKPGYEKIRFCGNQAKHDGLDYFWVDTCCIDKSSSTELQESISSMFRWYRNAAQCYVFLADVSRPILDSNDRFSNPAWVSEFYQSRWFKRGWTLQELIAPDSVIFFDNRGSRVGDKETLKDHVCSITGIAETALLRAARLKSFSVSERYNWARDRQTTRGEDWAYCLQGIFGVCISPLYNEGKVDAVRRLVQEIKNTVLGVNIQSIVIDADEHDQIVNPLVLDIALLETKVFYDQTKEQDERYESNIYNNARILLANNLLVSDMASMFISFLRRLLLSLAFPFGVHEQMEQQLGLALNTLRQVIASNKRIASNLQHDEECGREALNKMKKVHNFIRLVIKRDGEKQVMTEGVQEIWQQDLKYLELVRQFSELDEKFTQRNRGSELTIERLKAQQIETNARVEKLEAKLKEAENERRERAAVSLLGKIWAWISWLLSFL